MKRKKLTVIATILIVFMGLGTAVIPVFAVSDSKSRGNITLEDENGEMNLSADDIDYLQSEAEALYQELPDRDSVLPYELVRREAIKSKGIIDYAGGTVVMDASDLIYLADEVDLLEAAYKANTVDALNQIGTYFRKDGSVTYDPAAAVPREEAALSFDGLYHGILQSQSVAHLADRQAVDSAGTPLYFTDKEAADGRNLSAVTPAANDFPVFIQPASADNLSAGTAAWVNGQLLIGNGKDNEACYSTGYRKGGEDSIKHLYGGDSVSTNYPDVLAGVEFKSSDPLWTSGSSSKTETYEIPIVNEQGKLLYGISFQCQYGTTQHLENEASAEGNYSLTTEEGATIESSGQIVSPVTSYGGYLYKDVYIDLFSKSFSTEDSCLYLNLHGSASVAYVSFHPMAHGWAVFNFASIRANYK